MFVTCDIFLWPVAKPTVVHRSALAGFHTPVHWAIMGLESLESMRKGVESHYWTHRVHPGGLLPADTFARRLRC